MKRYLVLEAKCVNTEVSANRISKSYGFEKIVCLKMQHSATIKSSNICNNMTLA